MASIYSRELKNNVIKIRPKLFVNNFIPNGLQTLIEEKVPSGHYILGVTYSTGDSQICISGHPKEEETLLQGLKREIKEELALSCRKDIKEYKKIGINSFYYSNISDMKIDVCVEKNTKKDLNHRVVVCIHGAEKDILSYLAKVNYIEEFNEDQIRAIYAIRKENLISYLQTKSFSKLYIDI